MKKIYFSLIINLLLISFCTAQPFVKSKADTALTLKDLQIQFKQWKSTVNLKNEKYWKYFKRHEAELQLHTNANGEPNVPNDYIDALIKTADQKINLTKRSSTINWLPTRPNVLPNNYTGYMENGIGRINCIAFHPTDPNTFFVGVAQGGVWKTSNGGATYIPLTDQLPITRVTDIEIDPNNPNTMYISLCDYKYIGIGLFLNGRKRNTHYGLGVYKTIDGGITWSPTGLSFQLTNGDQSLIAKTIVNPNNSNQLVACGVSGMYTSSDAGNTWSKKLDSLFWDMVAVPSQPNVLYAATGWVQNAGIGNAAIYKSTDFGQTWTMLPTGFPSTGTIQRTKLAVAPSNPNCIYALTVDVNNGMEGLYKSMNAGNTWSNMFVPVNILSSGDGSSTGGQGNYDLALEVNALNENVIYTGGVNIWTSTDGGFTFDPASHWTLNYGPTLHGDIHFIKQQPNTNQIYVCSDGGLYRTSAIDGVSWNDINNGSVWTTQWTNLCSGLAVTSFYRLSSSKTTAPYLVAGAQDNATLYYDGTGWKTIFGGDGMDNCLDPLNPNVVIGSSQYGNFYYSIDNGISDNGWYPNVNFESGEWTTPVIADYNNPGTYYIGFENVVKTLDYGQTWNSISSFPINFASTEIVAMAVAKTNANRMYACKRVRYEFNEPGVVYTTSNGGVSWNDVTAGLPDSLYYTSVEVDLINSSTAYITLGGFTNGVKVFKTDNNGLSWSNITYNLPNIPVNCIKQIPTSQILLIATDIGVYKLDPGSTNWVNIGNGLPNVIVSDIEINAAQNKVYVSTFGRGIWETNISTISNIKENNIAEKFELFPSINKGSFNIKTELDNLTLEIIDITGRKVAIGNIKERGMHQLSYKLNSGKYFIRLSNQEFSAVLPFVVID